MNPTNPPATSPDAKLSAGAGAHTPTSEKNFVLDVTFGSPYGFCPIEDNGDIILGLTYLQDRCPGKLVAVFHQDGQEAVEAWCLENPDWRTRFLKDTTKDEA